MEDAISAFEGCAFRAWPAEIVRNFHGWQLRFMSGVTRRGNSVWPNQLTNGLELGERIRAVERVYTAERLVTRFQIGPRALPASLDAVLTQLGYVLEAPVSIQVAEATTIIGRLPAITPAVVEPAPSDSWLEVALRRSRFRDAPDVVLALLERLGCRALYSLVERDGQPVASGLGVIDSEHQGTMGIFSMHTLAKYRGRGLARAVIVGLARAAAERGATQLYLQVERDNAAALSLYAACGFTELYGYHYRSKAVALDTQESAFDPHAQ